MKEMAAGSVFAAPLCQQWQNKRKPFGMFSKFEKHSKWFSLLCSFSLHWEKVYASSFWHCRLKKWNLGNVKKHGDKTEFFWKRIKFTAWKVYVYNSKNTKLKSHQEDWFQQCKGSYKQYSLGFGNFPGSSLPVV